MTLSLQRNVDSASMRSFRQPMRINTPIWIIRWRAQSPWNHCDLYSSLRRSPENYPIEKWTNRAVLRITRGKTHQCSPSPFPNITCSCLNWTYRILKWLSQTKRGKTQRRIINRKTTIFLFRTTRRARFLRSVVRRLVKMRELVTN